MSVFLDTAVVVAVHNERDGNHERAVAVLEAVRRGEHGNAFSSDFVLDEAVTLAWVRTKDRRVAKAVGHFFLPPEGEEGSVVLLHVDEPVVRAAWASFLRHEAPLSFTDWTIVEQVRRLGIDRVATFDAKLRPWVPCVP